MIQRTASMMLLLPEPLVAELKDGLVREALEADEFEALQHGVYSIVANEPEA